MNPDNKPEIRKEKVVNGITYITIEQVAKDFMEGKYGKTENAEFEVVELEIKKIGLFIPDGKGGMKFISENIDNNVSE